MTGIQEKKAKWAKFSMFFLVLFIKVTMVITWLPLIRGVLDGDSYLWGLEYFGAKIGGAGTSGDYLFLIPINLIGIITLYSAYRSENRQIFHFFVTLWFAPIVQLFVQTLLTEDLILYGDTLGIEFNLTYVAIPMLLVLLGIIFYVIGYESINKISLINKSSWSRRGIAFHLILIPLQFVLLRFDGSGITDPIGVLLTIIQCLTLTVVFKKDQ